MVWELSTSGVALTSDFIAGFCGETEAAHQDTVSLLRRVKYNAVYCFPYSMRQVGSKDLIWPRWLI